MSFGFAITMSIQRKSRGVIGFLVGGALTIGTLWGIQTYYQPEWLAKKPTLLEDEFTPPPLDELITAVDASEFVTDNLPLLALPPNWKSYQFKPNDRLSSLWETQFKLPKFILYRILNTPDGKQKFNRIQPGQKIEWLTSRDGQLLALRLWHTKAAGSEWLQQAGAFVHHELNNSREVKLLRLEGQLAGMLINSLKDMPEIAGQEGALATALDRHLPLRRDARNGDKFVLLIEQEWLADGNRPFATNLLAFEYQGQNLQIKAAKHQDGRFYTPEGLSLIPPFDRIPLAQRPRVSSHFNMNRLHPITKRRAPHLGTDFAVPVGTRVLAPAKGRVIVNGWHPLAGRYMVVDHGQGYKTKYLHLSKALIAKGKDIKRGQLIAYSGNTGRSTGPHLHYELHINNRPVDALKATLPSVEKLKSKDLEKFVSLSENLFAGLSGDLNLKDLALMLPANEASNN